jgi:UDP:flavonoid glycosyltransferase YjiC (YdhE family)
MLKDLVLGYLEYCVRRLDEVADDARAIVGPMLSPAGGIVAEMRGIEHIPVALQPMVILSAYDPPYDPAYSMLLQTPQLSASIYWNRVCLAMLRTFVRAKYLRPVNDVRARLGLPRSNLTPVFGLTGHEPTVLGLYSSLMGSVQPDFPANTVLTGFPLFDKGEPDKPCEAATLQRLQAFITAGTAPIVFTLGSFAVFAPDNFYQTSLNVARRLRRRSVLLIGENDISVNGDDVFVARYVPHSQVFPHASVVVHHGGIGTTAQALLAGKPQVVVPHFADQFDNAKRLERLRVATSVPCQKYRVDRAAEAIDRAERLIKRNAIFEARKIVENESGAETAANAIIEALELPPLGGPT